MLCNQKSLAMLLISLLFIIILMSFSCKSTASAMEFLTFAGVQLSLFRRVGQSDHVLCCNIFICRFSFLLCWSAGSFFPC